MKITCLSDLHGFLPETPGGDLLILAGDYTANDSFKQWSTFFSWLQKQDYRKKILIAGNHDNYLYHAFPKTQEEADLLKEVCEDDVFPCDFEYLCNSGTEFTYEYDDIELEECGLHPTVERTIKIWGTPHSLWFPQVNPKCKSFMGIDTDICVKYYQIPDDIDILISHSPFLHILDQNIDGHSCGSYYLREAVDRVKPKYFICGHIHEQGGKQILYKHKGSNTFCINASYVNEKYKPTNEPYTFEF